ncbi:594_t:CDS:2 [Ambispora gerdemannii]|uniref:594_t:CDS:1 n=1 Tax=Ambispora gerdemannii TaxID=144530 RepID=A0A9N8VXJ6_9GLOM|nr:594_t:CDS:2 [Ambispora gerdemannii]
MTSTYSSSKHESTNTIRGGGSELGGGKHSEHGHNNGWSSSRSHTGGHYSSSSHHNRSTSSGSRHQPPPPPPLPMNNRGWRIGIPPPPLPRGSSWRPDYNIDRGGRGGGRWQNPPYNSSYRSTPYTTQRPPRNGSSSSSSSYPNYAPGSMSINHRGSSGGAGRGGYNTFATTQYIPRGRGRGISPWSTPTSSRPPPANVAELNVTAYYKKSMLEDPWTGLL